MARIEKPKWAQTLNVVRENDTINMYDLGQPKVPSEFIQEINSGIKAGFDDFLVQFADIERVYPNACAPIAGIIEYFKEHENIKFSFENVPPNVSSTNLLKPKSIKTSSEILQRNVLNRVWKFGTDEEVSQFVSCIIEELSKSEKFEAGVLIGLEWSLNEVMDNVIQHSNCTFGYAMGQIHKSTKHVAFTVFDHGQGFFNSLRPSIYHPRYPMDAIMLSIQEGVTRDKKIGQGNGLYGLNKIVNQNKGLLAITSAGAACKLSGDNTQTFNRLPFLSREHGTSCIDFQLDINHPISLSEALSFKGQPYRVVSLREEAVSTESGDIYYSVLEKSSGTGTRQAAERLRNDLLNYYTQAPRSIIIDFNGIAVMSSSFADEFIGKLVIEFGFLEFNRLVRIINMNETISTIAQRSIYQRIRESAS